MQPLSIVGTNAAQLAERVAARLGGRVAIVTRAGSDADDSPRTAGATDGGTARAEATDGSTSVDTELTLTADGEWSGSGAVNGFDEVLDKLAPDHEYLVAVGAPRLRVPTVLLGADTDPEAVPGTVLASAESPDAVDLGALETALESADPWITRETLVGRVTESADADRAGAIATFTGRVRTRDSPDDEPTTHLAFEAYEGVAESRMATIRDELCERTGVFDVRMHHRTGVIEAGEDIVFVVVLAGHRREAFRTVEDGIDRLKDEVPIFKKEVTDAEEFWVHHRD